MLYVPRRMPEPQSPAFWSAAAEEIVRLLGITRAAPSCSSPRYANMNAVAQRLAGRVPVPSSCRARRRGAVLLETFRRTPGAVLFATSSFWQGVDVARRAALVVIIDKLPFASPGDPVVAARIERLRNRGGNPFAEYQAHAHAAAGRFVRDEHFVFRVGAEADHHGRLNLQPADPPAALHRDPAARAGSRNVQLAPGSSVSSLELNSCWPSIVPYTIQRSV